MAFFAKARKEDLRLLAAEMNETVDENMKIVDLKNLITNSEEYEEVFVKALLENIISARLEQAELEENKRREEIQENKRREEIEAEEQRRKDEIRLEELKLEQRRLELKATSSLEEEAKTGKSYMQKFDIQKLVPRFDEKSDDISLFLALFERQAKIMQIPVEIWVAQLVSVLPSDIIALIAREPETEASSYEHIKKLLLKRFKLGPENFRQKFVKHQKKPDDTWRDFYYDIRKFLEEWLEGLEITTFEQLKDLMIVDQIKRRTPTDMREHFLDIWSTITSPTQLTEKLDNYEGIRQNFKRQPYGQQKEKSERKSETADRLRSPLAEKPWKTGVTKNDNRNPPSKFDMKSRNVESKSKFKCFRCGSDGHVAKFCPTKEKNKNTPIPQANLISTAKPENQDAANSGVLTAKISMPVAMTAANVDALEIVNIKCAGNNLKGIVDSGAQISVVRFDKIDIDDDSQGIVKIVSAFGESEEAPLRICMMKINDGVHGEVPIKCAISKKLISDILICRTAYDALKENVQLFYRDTEQADTWMAKQEAFLVNEDLGDSLDLVEALIKKHEDFEKSLAVQEEEMKVLDEFATKHIEGQHYAADDVAQRRVALLERRAALMEKSDIRRAMLEDSYRLQQFEKDCDETKGWISEKLKTAMDESYLDPTNVNGKVQKHQNFEQELNANKSRIDEIANIGQKLIEANHYASSRISERMGKILDMWKSLVEATERKGTKLNEAAAQQQLYRNFEDEEAWIREKEPNTVSTNRGHDLIGVQDLIKNHQATLAEINNHENGTISRLMSSDHTEAALKIQTQIEEENQKWQEVQQVAAKRAAQLGSSHKVQRFQRDVDKTKDWIREKDENLNTDICGDDLRSVQTLQGKHESLERDLVAFCNRMRSLDDNAIRLIQTHPKAAETIYTKLKEINEEWTQLTAKANAGKEKLLDSHDLQRFLADYRNLMSWIQSMMSLVFSEELANDVTGAEAFLERHQEHRTEIDVRAGTFRDFEMFGQQLLQSGHYASVEVQVISDHNPLTYLTKAHPHGAKLARWALALQRYNLQISYRKGIGHGNADALSRLPISE